MFGSGEASTNVSLPSFSHCARSQPKLNMLARMSSADSSKVTKTPFSPFAIPAARNCTAKTVLPLPAVPEINVVRFFGSPPLAMTSRLEIPVRSFSTAG